MYTEAHDSFTASLKLRPKDERTELARSNCAEHIRKIMTQSGGSSSRLGDSFGPDDEDEDE